MLLTAGVIPAASSVAAASFASVSCAASSSTTAAPETSLPSYQAITPVRVVDTRDGTGGVADQVGAGCTLKLDFTGSIAPVDAEAVALSVTAISAEHGFYTVYPCATGRPETSNLNARPNVPTPNLVVATPDAAGEVCIYSLARSDLIVDLAGWWSPGPNRLQTITPVRADDSRLTNPAPLSARTVRAVPLAGSFIPADATAALINLTVTEPGSFGFLTAYPCGTEPPLASNLNFVPGESRAVSAIVGIGETGAICVYSNTSYHVVIDVSGYYAPAPQFGPTVSLASLPGERIASSRDGIGGWSGLFGTGTVRQLDPVVTLPDAGTASSVVLNVTIVNATAPGFVTVYPCAAERPFVSAVNYVPDSEATNLVVVDLSASRTVCFYTSSPVDVIVDLFGVMHAPPSSLTDGLTFDSYTWPPFDADSSDYVVECGTDGQARLDLALLPSVTARLNGITISPGATTVEANPDDLLRLRLTRGSETDSYWFRCAPADFPRLLVDRSGSPDPGWYLTALQKSGQTAGYLVVLNNYGAPVWYKRVPGGGLDLKRRSDGRLIYTPFLGNAFGVTPARGYRITTLSGSLVAEHLTDDPSSFPTDHHDYVALPAGKRAMLSYPLVRDQPGPDDPDPSVLGPSYFDADSIVDGVIREIDAAGHLVWSWRTSDKFGLDEVRFPVRFGLYPAEPNGGEVDVWHLNSLDVVDDGSGDYVLSARHLDAVFRVDRATGNLDWILGTLPSVLGASGYVANKSGATRLTVLNDPLGGPLRSHDARLRGNVLTLFDNRHANGVGQAARAVAYRIDEQAKTATMLWQISNPTGLPSFGFGSTGVAADGDVLVDWGGLQPMFQEFTSAGQPLMTISQDGGGGAYRIVKEALASFDINSLRANAGGSVETP